MSTDYQNYKQILIDTKSKLKKFIVLKIEKQAFQKEKESIYFQHILDPQKSQESGKQQTQFQSNFPSIFNQIMMDQGCFQQLYFTIYGIIQNEMTENKDKKSGIQSIQDNQGEQAQQYIFSSNLIKIIMQKVELQISEYNKQFSNFGIILNDLGERYIYYYSLFLIWRFVCQKKKINLLQNKKNFEQLYHQEFQKFEAEITQNKAQQSKLKAQRLVSDIIGRINENFHDVNKKEALEKVKSLEITSFDLIRQLDDQFLNCTGQQNQNTTNEILFYIQDQKQYIETYVQHYVKNKVEKITKELQRNLSKEMKTLLESLLKNARILNQLIGEKLIKTKTYFTQTEEKEEIYEQNLFSIVFSCLQGEKSQNLNLLDQEYQSIFQKENYFPALIPERCGNISASFSDQQIQSLNYFVAEIVSQLQEKLQFLEKIVELKIEQLDIQGTIDHVRLVMNGCQQVCPMCNRKCDLDNQKHEKHQCQNGHYLRGMNKVLNYNRPSLFSCEEITDDCQIQMKMSSQVKTWKVIQTIYPEWSFKSLNKESLEKNKLKMKNSWNHVIGEIICDNLKQELNIDIQFQVKDDQKGISEKLEKVHYIFVLDDSDSMKGERWNNIKRGTMSCIQDLSRSRETRVTRVVEDCSYKTHWLEYQLVLQFKGGGTSYGAAFEAILQQIIKHQKQNFSKIIILFYTDGASDVDDNVLEKFIKLPEQIKSRISLIACSEEENTAALAYIVQKLQNHFHMAICQNSIQTSAVQDVFKEFLNHDIRD